MAAHKREPLPKELTLPTNEWDFHGGPKSEQAAAFYYELCRSSDYIKTNIADWKAQSPSPNFHQLALDLARAGLGKTSKLKSSLRKLADHPWPKPDHQLAIPRELPASFAGFPSQPWRAIPKSDPAKKYWIEYLKPRKLFTGGENVPEGFHDLRDTALNDQQWEEMREWIKRGMACAEADQVALFRWSWFDFTVDELCAQFGQWVVNHHAHWSKFKVLEQQRTRLGPVPFLWANGLRALSIRRRFEKLRSPPPEMELPKYSDAEIAKMLISHYGELDPAMDRKPQPTSPGRRKPAKGTRRPKRKAFYKEIEAWVRWGQRLVDWASREYLWRADMPPSERSRKKNDAD